MGVWAMRSEWAFDDRKIVVCVGDITQTGADAIVNAANSSLMGGGGVDGAIHRAGGPKIDEECRQIAALMGPLPVGDAVITTGGTLPAKQVIHTVGPVWKGGGHGEEEALAKAYSSSVALAQENGVATLAFPSISTGAFGYPVNRAAPVALESVRKALESATGVKEVDFVLYDAATFEAYESALEALRAQVA